MFKKIIDICIAYVEKSYSGLSLHMVFKLDGKSSSLYYKVINMEDINCISAFKVLKSKVLITTT